MIALALILAALGLLLLNAALSGKPIGELLAGLGNLRGRPKFAGA